MAAGAGGLVLLRGLTIDLRGTKNIGILIVSGGALHVHDSVIRRAEVGVKILGTSGIEETYFEDSVMANNRQRNITEVLGGTTIPKAKSIIRHHLNSAEYMRRNYSFDATTGNRTGPEKDQAAPARCKGRYLRLRQREE